MENNKEDLINEKEVEYDSFRSFELSTNRAKSSKIHSKKNSYETADILLPKNSPNENNTKKLSLKTLHGKEISKNFSNLNDNKEDNSKSRSITIISSNEELNLMMKKENNYSKNNYDFNFSSDKLVRLNTNSKNDLGSSSKKLVTHETQKFSNKNELVRKQNSSTFVIDKRYTSGNMLKSEKLIKFFEQEEDNIISERVENNESNNNEILKIKYKNSIMKKMISSLHKNVSEEEFIHFLMNPLPKEKTLNCKIIKTSKNIYGKLFPKYSLYLLSNDKFLLSGQKVYKTTSTTFHLSLDENIVDEKDSNYLGKISSNFIGNEFNIFDNGTDPKLSKNEEEYRKQHAAVIYDLNILGIKGPRKMKVYFPEIDKESEEYYINKPTDKTEYLQNMYKKDLNKGIKILVNKDPEWDDIFKTFSLKFNGRVEKSSKKNFQLIQEDKPSEIILQFGRINESSFALDFQYPLSPFLAFSLSLTSLSSKIACE